MTFSPATVQKILKWFPALEPLFKKLFEWGYVGTHQAEIQAGEEKRKAALDEVAALKTTTAAKVATDQQQIDQAEGEKAVVVEQIKAEQTVQAKDESTIKQVQDDLDKKLADDRRESSHDLNRDQF